MGVLRFSSGARKGSLLQPAGSRLGFLVLLVLFPTTATTRAPLPVYSTFDELPGDVDAPGHLKGHLLVLPADGACEGVTAQVTDFFAAAAHARAHRSVGLASGELAAELGLAGHCGRALCLEKGTPKALAKHWNLRFEAAAEARKAGWGGNLSDAEAFRLREFQDWYLPECQGAEIGFVSYHDNPINVFWVDEATGGRVEQGLLRRGERNTAWRSSHIGHKFALVDAETAEELGTYEVKYTSFYAIFPEKFTVDPLSAEELLQKEREIQSTLRFEYDRSRGVKRSFTPTGFAKGGLPQLDPYVWGSVQAFYHNNKAHGAVREEWDHKGLYVNWWEAEPLVIQMPWKLKTMWHDRMRILVEEWIGGEALERTDIYGIRVYQRGARLLSHVDRFETHAASLIVNVAQEGTDPDTPWPVEIYDHSDHLHEVSMDPGDIVYYESAKCLHARMQPLSRGSYANLFVHYRPDGDPGWFRKDNPPHGPAPVTAAWHAEETEAWQRGNNNASAGSEGGIAMTTRPSRDGQSTVHLQPLADANALADYWYKTRWSDDHPAAAADDGFVPSHGGGLDRKSHSEL